MYTLLQRWSVNNQLRFPPDCHVVGEVSVSRQGELETSNVYVEGIHPELHLYGPVSYQQKGDGSLETIVRVVTGLPPEVFLG